MTYSQKLRDPRWQKVRLKVFERDDWKCQRAGCRSPKTTTLVAHHKSYLSGRDPWDYPLTNFVTFCEKCHDRVHTPSAARASGKLIEGGIYPWVELPTLLGFTPDKYLTEQKSRIVCACVRLDYNPDAPDILLPGDYQDIVTRSQSFARQKEFIPVFIKAMDAGWEYCGRYRVETATTNAIEIQIHQSRVPARKVPISMVLILEKQRPSAHTASLNPRL